MSITLNTAYTYLKRSHPLYIDSKGHLKTTSLLQRIYRLSPRYAIRQDLAVGRLFTKHLQENANPLLIKCSELFKKNILRRFIFKTPAVKKLNSKLTFQLNTHLLAGSLNFSNDLLRKHAGFVDFAFKNHFHHRVDAHYQNKNLGIKYNGLTDTFELPVKAKYGVEWHPWQTFPLNKRGKIDGYDLLAHGWEKHSNKTWRIFKPFKVITQDEFKKRFPKHKSPLTKPCIELVTTIPTFGKPPGQFGHVYVNFYVPQNGRIKFYSIGYDLTDLSVPDVLEFIDRKRVSSLRKLSLKQWQEAKLFIETIQKIHIKRRKNGKYVHPDKIAIEFYKRHMGKNCGNFAVALFEKFTGIQNLYTLFPIMRVLFPKPFHYISDWIEERLPGFLRYLIQRVNIVLRGVIPWKLIPKQKALESGTYM